jgi:hypothetical protein
MNPLLLEIKYAKYSKDLHMAFKAIDEMSFSMPIQLYPDELFHIDTKNTWDRFENDKFIENYDQSVNYWNSLLGVARRLKKLERKRIKNKSYCNKSDRNFRKVLSII